MNTDSILTIALLDWLYLYEVLNDELYIMYKQKVNDFLPFSILYVINGKYKYLSYMEEDPLFE